MSANSLKAIGKNTYRPDWISEATVCDWVNVDRSTLYRLRQTGKLNYSMFSKTVMYDKNEIVAMLNAKSTFPISNPQINLV